MIRHYIITDSDIKRVADSTALRTFCLKCLKKVKPKLRLHALSDVCIDGASAKHIFILQYIRDTEAFFDKYEASIRNVCLTRVMTYVSTEEEALNMVKMWEDPEVVKYQFGTDTNRKHTLTKLALTAEFSAIAKDLGIELTYLNQP